MLKTEDGFKEFYESIKDKYPHLNYLDIARICSTPLRFLERAITKNILPKIRLKWLGVFTIKRGMAFHELIKIRSKFNNGIVTKEHLEEKENKLLMILKRYEDENENNEEECD